MFEFIIMMLVIGWVFKSVLRSMTEADIRRQQLRFTAQTNAASTSEIQQLRAEIAQLRETTTQHAMSLQHSVERLDHRVEFMERKSVDSMDRGQQPQQVVGR